jgi:hypothetical protein
MVQLAFSTNMLKTLQKNKCFFSTQNNNILLNEKSYNKRKTSIRNFADDVKMLTRLYNRSIR